MLARDEQIASLLGAIKEAAEDEGFIRAQVAPAIDSRGFSDLVRWIEAGYAGGMHYFAGRQDAYRHPDRVLEGVKSIVVLAYPYAKATQADLAPQQGRISRYAWSETDYHDVIHAKLKRLCRLITDTMPEASSRGIIDTAPLMEREVAQLAGLGWRGKNTLLLNKQLGSYFFLACVLTDLPLPIDSPHEPQHCGSCTACLDACPTDAFPKPGVLDATRCISYLTIEHRESIPLELRDGIGDWLFGCDVCQDVCPWNRKPARNADVFEERFDRLDLCELFEIDDDEFRRRFRKTPLWRTRRRGVLRNAAIVLGNSGANSATKPLSKGLQDVESIVRGASAWALGKIGGNTALQMLEARSVLETDTEVRQEIANAIFAIERAS